IALAEDSATKMKTTLNVAHKKEPKQVAEIRKYYMQISKWSGNSERYTRSDIAFNLHSMWYNNGKKVFHTIQSWEEREDKLYTEFLFDQQTGELIFAYQNHSYEDERGKQNPQLRCYWHKGKLIHSKIKKDADLETTCDDLLKEAEHFRNLSVVNDL
ncbi:MAG: hypothetical protein IJM09_05095, partial [Neisseriaceae bacterium]|nr:hypothetical protein [Neisseriaceae bacterium]